MGDGANDLEMMGVAGPRWPTAPSPRCARKPKYTTWAGWTGCWKSSGHKKTPRIRRVFSFRARAAQAGSGTLGRPGQGHGQFSFVVLLVLQLAGKKYFW